MPRMNLDRRQMIARTGSALLAALCAPAVAPLLADADKRRFKIGACDWSLRKPDPSCMALAKQIGLDGVQINMGNAENRMWLRRPEVQKTYLDAAAQNGVEIGGLALGELNNIPLKSDPRAAVWLVDAIDVAKALGVKVILVAQFYKGDLKDDPAGIGRTVELLQEIAPRAERAEVILGLENYLSAEENLEIVRRVGSPAVQVYYDVGNSTDKGYDIYKEIRMLKGQFCELHVKDGDHVLGKGRINFEKVREALDEIGYRGWIHIEAAAPNGPAKDYPATAEYLRRLFPRQIG
ncbi:MAG: sugar phosphate isomerase/epimerase family protein [Verrucomicrobiota bacterium]|nr:sugar phosphate isomerase/epimerase family protein [Verrucomicrobiota bacterium]